jgi:predicted RecB family nuclease
MKMTGRYYTIDGVNYPSVTTILNVLNKPQLVNWAVRLTRDSLKQELFALQRSNSLQDLNADSILARSASEHSRVKNAAADHGIDIHRRIAACVGDKSSRMSKNVRDPVIIAFRAWQDEAQFLPIASEKLVISREHEYAGTADLIGTLNGKLALLDIKTGRRVYPEYKLQLAAYAIAWGEMKGSFPQVCMNLHVRSDFTIVEANTFTAAELFPLFQTFLAAKRLFEWLSIQPKTSQNIAVATPLRHIVV